MYLEGFLSVITDPEMYLVILLGVAVGIVFGAIPGLTATMAITMCLVELFTLPSKRLSLRRKATLCRLVRFALPIREAIVDLPSVGFSIFVNGHFYLSF